MTTYTPLSAQLGPADKGSHDIVRIDHPLLAKPLLVTARFAPERMTWPDAKKWAEGLTLGGMQWRLPSVEEAFFIPDRSKYPAFDRETFMGADGNWPCIWTATTDAEDPAGCAWYVLLHDGSSGRSYQGYENRVLAVRAGQF